MCVHNSYDIALRNSLVVNFFDIVPKLPRLTVYSVLAVTQATRAYTHTHTCAACMCVCLRVWLRVTLNPLCWKLSNFHLSEVAMFVE